MHFNVYRKCHNDYGLLMGFCKLQDILDVDMPDLPVSGMQFKVLDTC